MPDKGSRNGNSLLLTTGQFSTLEAALSSETVGKVKILESVSASVNVSFNGIEAAVLGLLLHYLFHDFNLFVVLLLTDKLNDGELILFHCL